MQHDVIADFKKKLLKFLKIKNKLLGHFRFPKKKVRYYISYAELVFLKKTFF